MKTKVAIVMVGVLLCWGGLARADDYTVPDKDFNSSGSINDGESWGEVNIYGNDTVVEMFHWSHTMGLITHNESTFNLYGGHIDRWLIAKDNSTINLYGGSNDVLTAENSAVINVYNAPFLDIAATGGTIFLHAYDVMYDPTEGGLGGGMLTGKLCQNNSSFTYYLYEGTYEHVTIVPEPATLLLLAIGGVLLRNKK